MTSSLHHRCSLSRSDSTSIVVKKPGVTIDGRGAWLIGASKGAPKSLTGTAISAEGVSQVILKNINAKGWETALHVRDGDGWQVENCNFSDNFHDPDFGWGENGRRGGIVLTKVSRSTLKKNKATFQYIRSLSEEI